MRLKLRLPSTSAVVTLQDDASFKHLLQEIGKIDPSLENIRVKAGFPPKEVQVLDYDDSLEAIGVKSGEQFTIEKAAQGAGIDMKALGFSAANSTNSTTITQSESSSAALGTSDVSTVAKSSPFRLSKASDGHSCVICEGFGTMRLNVVPDDNSCLFRAVGYNVLGPFESAQEFRKIVAEYIVNHPEEYDEATLEKKPAEYAAWIVKDTSWGGSIELNILAQSFDISIVSFDIAHGRKDVYNPGKDAFTMVAYSGIHYDAVVLETESGLARTVFQNDENGELALEAAKVLCEALKSENYYTDTARFKVKCGVCGKVLQGEKNAIVHAKQTGHTDFTENS